MLMLCNADARDNCSCVNMKLLLALHASSRYFKWWHGGDHDHVPYSAWHGGCNSGVSRICNTWYASVAVCITCCRVAWSILAVIRRASCDDW